MSTTIDNNSINNNKDYDNNIEIWSDSRLENSIFNKVMDSRDKYIQQAITKFRFFRLMSPSTIFEFDIIPISIYFLNYIP
ncbi:MAG TPA: hypothetical protein VIY08_11350 [Candidatus Nitrosocosmicus sp.]